MLTLCVGILIGALIEQSYPFVGNTFKWVKEKLNKK